MRKVSLPEILSPAQKKRARDIPGPLFLRLRLYAVSVWPSRSSFSR